MIAPVTALQRWPGYENKEIIMETLLVLILLVIVIALDIAAWRWGFDSTEKIDSPEWKRRATWYAHLAGREKEI